MSDVLEFTDLFQEYRGAMLPGKLKLQASSLVYKNSKSGKVDQYQGADIEEAQWIKRARGKCLRIVMKTGFVYTFDGFKDSDFTRISEFLKKNYDVVLERKETSVKGWNWGHPKFNANTMEFQVDDVTSFEIPLANVSHSRLSKNEVTLEFHPNEDAPVSVVEATFYSLTVAAAEELHNNIVSRAEEQATGDAITIFNEIQCLTPRGRYDIKIYPSFLQLHGKTFDYKILYRSIVRLFLLPHRDGRQFYFMVGLDPPIRQGQTRYHFLIFLFSKEVEMTLEMSMSEKDLEEKYDGRLKKEMTGPEQEVITEIIKVLVDKKITMPKSFMGHSRTHSIACSYRAATGFLYPLEKGFAYVHKPPLFIKFDEVASVNFGRSAGSTRSFDFDVETKGGISYNFVGIEKDEYGQLNEFVKTKNLRVKTIDKVEGRKLTTYREDDVSDDDKVHNAYMEKMKHEGKDRDGDDDDDDESDESFKPEDSESEPDDEYDSNHESSGSEADLEPKKKKQKVDKDDAMEVDGDADDDEHHHNDKHGKKEKKEKRKKKEEEEDDDDDDEDDEEEEEKKDKKKKKEKVKESKKTGEKKKKKEKDPNKPKRAMSAYFIWLAEVRDKLKAEFPGLSQTELTKKAGEKWRSLEDKKKWENLAKKEKGAYDEAMAHYKKDGGSSHKISKESKKSKSSKTESSQSPGAAFKSKEFISDEESNDHDDQSDMSD